MKNKKYSIKNKTVSSRSAVLFFVFIILFSIIITKLAYLQLYSRNKYSVEAVSYTHLVKIYNLSKKDKKEIKSYSLDGKDLVKIFKDAYSAKNDSNVVLTENKNLTDMLSSYIFADKVNYEYLVCLLYTSYDNNINGTLKLIEVMREFNVKNIIFRRNF